MASQTTTGKAFEYAVLDTLRDSVADVGAVEIVSNSSLEIARTQFLSLASEVQAEYVSAAQPAVKMLLRLEPHATVGLTTEDKLQLSIQSDQAGGDGDVRDIVVSRPLRHWEIGISAKHQHEAMKHSRLSMSIDFGDKWLGKSCNTSYFDEIRPVFDFLADAKRRQMKWSEIEGKDTVVYVPILQAFRKELLRLAQENPTEIAANLALYLIGRMDFYKIMKLDQLTSVQAFNLKGSLNSAAGSLKAPVKLNRLKLPGRIIELAFKPGSGETTTLLLVCDEGWQISFRIHSASTYVEPSLKFDITVVGKPNSLRTFDFLWGM